MIDDSLKVQVKELIVKSLRLTMSPSDIADDITLFGEGLGLDSIDALELVLGIERTFGVSIGDEHVGREVLRCVNSISEFIVANRPANVSGPSVT